MLVEPSSGSYMSTYLPPRRSSRTCTGIGCSSSSDATTHTRPVCSTACRTVSLANTSSFCCTSPWTLIAPNSPRMSVSPARRTWREMIFAARQMSYSRFDSSPVASGWSRSCSMMNRSIVTTDVGDCERAMTRDGEGDRAPLVGTEHGDAMSSQPCQRFGRGMTVAILRAHADHGIDRLQLIEPAVRRGTTRPVVPDLQQRHAPDAPREMGLRRHARVPREQESRGAVGHEEHDRLLIDVRLADRPRRIRAQHFERYAVQLQPIATSCRAPLCPVALDGAEEPKIARVRHRLPRLEDEGRIERIEHGGEAAEMIEMSVRGHDCRQLRGTCLTQERHHDPAAGISLRSPRPAVDQQPPPSRTAQRNRVTLADVKETYGET